MDDINEKLTGLKTILTKVQSFCAYQDRCSAEVIQKLRDWGVDETRIPPIIASLTEDKFLNDCRYAESFVSSKFRLKHWGRNKIAYELRGKKIPSDLISESLDTIDEEEYESTVQTLITKKSKEVKDTDPFRKKQKVARFLISKGFEPELVFKMINN